MTQIRRLSLFPAIAIGAVVLLAACSPQTSDSPTASATPQAAIEVEQQLLDVVVTLPASFFSELTPEEIVARAEDAGYRADVAADGSVTYTIPRIVYQTLMQDLTSGIEQSISETLETETSINDIAHNAEFTSFTMTVDRAAFEGSLSAGFVALGLGLQGMFFQSFNGVAEADRRVVVSYVDGATGEAFGSYVLPDALE